jgi:1-pyrroline-5-carboxylate dehydrogenase
VERLKPILELPDQVSLVMEQFLRLLHECGMPLTDVDFINSDGPVMNNLLLQVLPDIPNTFPMIPLSFNLSVTT